MVVVNFRVRTGGSHFGTLLGGSSPSDHKRAAVGLHCSRAFSTCTLAVEWIDIGRYSELKSEATITLPPTRVYTERQGVSYTFTEHRKALKLQAMRSEPLSTADDTD
ncbi:unnamed protein product [Sympodiomycopsis kandeliae]